jgi:arginyl-tRNA synthetase
VNVATLLAARVREAIVRAFGPEYASADPAVHRSSFADFQADAALRLAKPLKKPPLELAKAILAALDVKDLCPAEGALTVSPPGFVNFVLGREFLEGAMTNVLADERAAVGKAERTERVVIDYSGPNIAKEMHVGHIRSTVIGDSLARVLGFLGHDVVRQNHVGDWGTPFGMLIEHLTDIGADAAARELSQGSLNEFYKAARQKFDADPAFADRARQRVVLLQGGDETTLEYWRVLVDASRRYFDGIYRRLGVLLLDSDVRGESFYNPFLAEVAEDLQTREVARIDDGALCVFMDEFKGRDGALLPLIVRKQDGGYGYAATDLSALRYRARDLSASRILYVTGAPQEQHFAMCFAAARKAGYLPEGARAEHVKFGSILGADKKMVKTREGDSIRLSALIDEAIERARAAIAQKNPELPADSVTHVAELVGVGALKYADLSSDRIKDYVFDWDRMLAFEGNTGPYLQYAHARLVSIERKARDTRVLGGERAPVALGHEAERRLALELSELEPVLLSVAETLQPHRLTTYLFTLATTFTTFYESCPVLRAETPELRASRLTLCFATRRVLSLGLDLLGMGAPERM